MYFNAKSSACHLVQASSLMTVLLSAWLTTYLAVVTLIRPNVESANFQFVHNTFSLNIICVQISSFGLARLRNCVHPTPLYPLKTCTRAILSRKLRKRELPVATELVARGNNETQHHPNQCIEFSQAHLTLATLATLMLSHFFFNGAFMKLGRKSFFNYKLLFYNLSKTSQFTDSSFS